MGDSFEKKLQARFAAVGRTLMRYAARCFARYVVNTVVPLILSTVGLYLLIALCVILAFSWLFEGLPQTVGTLPDRTAYEHAIADEFPPILSPNGEEENYHLAWGVPYAIDYLEFFAGGKWRCTAEETARALRPSFDYRDSVIVEERRVRRDDGSIETVRTETPVKLVVVARTYVGTYSIHYRWATEQDEGVKTRREVKDYVEFTRDPSALAQVLKSRYGYEPDADLVLMVEKLGNALTKGEPDVAWLMDEEESWVQFAMEGKWGSDLPPPSGPYMWPLEGSVTSVFGYREHPVYGVRMFHAGIDIAVPIGTPVRSANDGIVRFAGAAKGYGYLVAVDHGGGTVSLYGHNSSLSVTEGQSVRRGDIIALSGNTGVSTGPHLHFEMRVKGKPVDPVTIIAGGE